MTTISSLGVGLTEGASFTMDWERFPFRSLGLKGKQIIHASSLDAVTQVVASTLDAKMSPSPVGVPALFWTSRIAKKLWVLEERSCSVGLQACYKEIDFKVPPKKILLLLLDALDVPSDIYLDLVDDLLRMFLELLRDLQAHSLDQEPTLHPLLKLYPRRQSGYCLVDDLLPQFMQLSSGYPREEALSRLEVDCCTKVLEIVFFLMGNNPYPLYKPDLIINLNCLEWIVRYVSIIKKYGILGDYQLGIQEALVAPISVLGRFFYRERDFVCAHQDVLPIKRTQLANVFTREMLQAALDTISYLLSCEAASYLLSLENEQFFERIEVSCHFLHEFQKFFLLQEVKTYDTYFVEVSRRFCGDVIEALMKRPEERDCPVFYRLLGHVIRTLTTCISLPMKRKQSLRDCVKNLREPLHILYERYIHTVHGVTRESMESLEKSLLSIDRFLDEKS